MPLRSIFRALHRAAMGAMGWDSQPRAPRDAHVRPSEFPPVTADHPLNEAPSPGSVTPICAACGDTGIVEWGDAKARCTCLRHGRAAFGKRTTPPQAPVTGRPCNVIYGRRETAWCGACGAKWDGDEPKTCGYRHGAERFPDAVPPRLMTRFVTAEDAALMDDAAKIRAAGGRPVVIDWNLV